jgi:hypothetical protein
VGLRTREQGDEVENLRRVDAPVRAGASASGPSETPESRRLPQAALPRRCFERLARKLMGGGLLEAAAQGLVTLKALKRQNPKRASDPAHG